MPSAVGIVGGCVDPALDVRLSRSRSENLRDAGLGQGIWHHRLFNMDGSAIDARSGVTEVHELMLAESPV